jgi:Domain of unknown function (DUF4124)
MKRVLLCAALIAWSGMASAVVYKWVDAKGNVLYGDRPPDGVHAEVVELLGSHAARSPAPAAAAAPTAPATPRNPANPADSSVKKTVDDDVAQTRDKQCADAQARYKQLIEGRRIYKTGPDGERQYLTSDEIDEQRVNAKRDVDTICNSST